MNNSFTGPIPEFNRLGALKALYLSDNAFSGGIKEDYFLKMESLKKLWMSDNKFTGPIPISLAKLTNLKELHLEGNQFSGPIPPLPALTSLNFSNNNLEGQIPTGLSKFNANSFLGNAGLCGKPLSVECKVVPPTAPPESAQLPEQAPPSLKDEASVTAAIVTLVLVILTLAVATIIVVKRRREFDVLGGDSFHEPIELHMPPPASTSKEVESATISNRGDLIVVNEERSFGLPDLMKAAAEVLGNGSLGSAYKAVMTNGVAVVVKRMRDMNKLGKDGFDMELRRYRGDYTTGTS
ncbi:hypothetical protein IFM89_028519 [Coptis chinensis]|uniref:Uncharacterized protein n=1 Tax=Coptis chinensis TaxID=261450 RepID=A0A835IGB5_9MAGN|nr:hypothetical protein IFM89_028519 [Coptis chinensis]